MSARLLYSRLSDDDARSVLWETDETPPRSLEVAGTASVDPDVFVAYEVGKKKPLWIVKSSGHVCGLAPPGDYLTEIIARPASGMSASGQDPQGLEAKPASPTAESGDAQ